jgi:hypothetical protein
VELDILLQFHKMAKFIRGEKGLMESLDLDINKINYFVKIKIFPSLLNKEFNLTMKIHLITI